MKSNKTEYFANAVTINLFWNKTLFQNVEKCVSDLMLFYLKYMYFIRQSNWENILSMNG